MKQKKLMLLGGLRYLLPVIKAAHDEGYYVITCDYLPENIAHKYSDEYCNVSIIDKEAVLQKALELEIDGIMSFAVDPGVVTASYVAEKMNLPFAGSYKSVQILQNKDYFRKFLSENGFNVPMAGGYKTYADLMEEVNKFKFPVIVKPTDSAGSKGVSRVDNIPQLKTAFEYALKFSLSGSVIVEEFIEKFGCSSDSDSFSVDGKLEVVTFSAQRFDSNAANPYTPSAYSWPCTFAKNEQQYLKAELQRLMTLLNLKTSIYNIETRVGQDGKPYIMEVSPRGGGNRLAEMAYLVTGADLIKASVRAAVGDSINSLEPKESEFYWAEVILHADKAGIFESMEISPEYMTYVYQTDLWIAKGDMVNDFKGANDTIGTLILRFTDKDVMERALKDIGKWIKINVI